MLVDTGSVHHYLPSTTAELLFHKDPLLTEYLRIHFLATPDSPLDTADAGWQLLSDTPNQTPIRLVFAGSKMQWPLDLISPLNDEYASIMSAASSHPAVLGMPFISQRGIIFDFTKGKERIGFITNEIIHMEDDTLGHRPRERFLQFVVGASLGLGIAAGFKWYEGGSLF
jgi:hypothetical protein